MTAQIPDPDLTQLRFSLARARAASGMTLEKLAERSGVGRQTILDIGSGKFKGGIETWIRLARALDVSLDSLTSPVWKREEPTH